MIGYPLGTDSVTVRRAPLTAPPADRYGALRRDWTAATATIVAGVSVQPVTAAETTVDREWASTRLMLFAPGDTSILATDRIDWRGTTYEVDGPAQEWIDDTGGVDHIEVVLKLMTG